jgi:hypothetical protein
MRELPKFLEPGIEQIGMEAANETEKEGTVLSIL